MPDWGRFHNAIVANTRPVALANACAQTWRWLDLAPEARTAAVSGAIRTESDARMTAEGLVLVRRRLWREAGCDPDNMMELQTALADAHSGRAGEAVSAAVRRVETTIALGSLVLERFPAAAPSGDGADLASLNAATPALSAAVEGTGTGVTTPDSLEALQHAIEVFTPIGQDFGLATKREHAWWMGLAWWAMGRGALELARHTEAQDAFARAASFYDAAGEDASAAACRQSAHGLALRLMADFDAATTPDLQQLLSQQDPMQRAATLTRLSREVGRAGDRFEAAELSEQAARLLDQLGFPDPEHTFDSALQQWIATAAETRGTDVFARLCEVTECWAAVMGARTNLRMSRDPVGSARAERTLRGLAGLPAELTRQADLATQATLERLAVWDPGAIALMPSRSASPSDDAVMAPNDLDDALHALRVACNEGASDFQLTQAAALHARAEALGSRVHGARARIEHSYILLALDRHDEAIALAGSALQALLDGKPARLGSFATGYERELYLMAITYKARALAALKDHRAILVECEPVIRDIEAERQRVSSPYQASAFLATRTELYEMVAAAAYRAGEADLLLTTTERLKARGILTSLTRGDGDGLAAERELRQVNDALRHATPGSAEETALRERRRWLSPLAATEQPRLGAVASDVSVAALQNVLADDEAAISWFWIGTSVTLVLAFTSAEQLVSVVELDVTQQRELNEYLECLTALGGHDPSYDQLVPRVHDLIDGLGAALLPAATRTLVADKRRLVFSPHRGLHLFPFHAVPWPDDRGVATRYPIERFAIRYAPNLTSLLLPWQGNDSGPVLAVGVGRFDDPSVSPLPSAELEAAAVAAAHGASGEALLGADRSAFEARALGNYRCLHLATHGSSVLTGDALDDPMQSCVLLRDGALTAWDLSSFDLHAELVVLAACHSGQRSVAGRGLETLPGDDIFGLQAVLFEAGVWSVLGTLWPVEDGTATAILLDFHRAYAAGATPDRALHSAIRTHLASAGRRHDVFDWAPFFLSALGRPSMRAASGPSDR
jgi:CHAT domain-containing protein